MNDIIINFFGNFSISNSEKQISCPTHGDTQAWLLLKHLFFNRARRMSKNEISELLWGKQNEEDKDRKESLIKTVVFKARKVLALIDIHDAVICHEGMYYINPEIDVISSDELFENYVFLFKTASDPEQKTDYSRKVFDIYKGRYTTGYADNVTVTKKADEYEKIFFNFFEEAISLLYSQSRFFEAENLLNSYISLDPSNEVYNFHLIKLLHLKERTAEALSAYERYIIITDSKCKGRCERIDDLGKRLKFYSNVAINSINELESILLSDNSRVDFLPFSHFKSVFSCKAKDILREENLMLFFLRIKQNDQGKIIPTASISAEIRELLLTLLPPSSVFSMADERTFIALIPYSEPTKTINKIERALKAQKYASELSFEVKHKTVMPLNVF